MAAAGSLPPSRPPFSGVGGSVELIDAGGAWSSASAAMVQQPGVVMHRVDPAVERTGKIRTYSGGLHGPESTDDLIDRGGNRPKMEAAFEGLEERLKNEGKHLRRIWPRSLKVDWVDEQGRPGVTYLDSTDPAIAALRDIYRSDRTEGKGGKEGKLQYDVAEWPCTPPGVRGDMNGPAPLQKGTERLRKRTAEFRQRDKEGAIEGIAPAQQQERLRKVALGGEFTNFLFDLAEERREALRSQLANQVLSSDQEGALRDLIAQYERIHSLPIDHFAISWALSHPTEVSSHPTASQIKSAHQRAAESLKQAIRGEEGERIPVHPASHMVPGGAPLNRAINWAFNRREAELTQEEREYADDVQALLLTHPEGSIERWMYRSAIETQKQDCLEQLIVKLVKGIDHSASGEDHAEVFFNHPVFARLIGSLSAEEQILIREKIHDFVEKLKKVKDALTGGPAAVAPAAAPSPPSREVIGEFNRRVAMALSAFVQPKEAPPAQLNIVDNYQPAAAAPP